MCEDVDNHTWGQPSCLLLLSDCTWEVKKLNSNAISAGSDYLPWYVLNNLITVLAKRNNSLLPTILNIYFLKRFTVQQVKCDILMARSYWEFDNKHFSYPVYYLSIPVTVSWPDRYITVWGQSLPGGIEDQTLNIGLCYRNASNMYTDKSLQFIISLDTSQ